MSDSFPLRSYELKFLRQSFFLEAKELVILYQISLKQPFWLGVIGYTLNPSALEAEMDGSL